MATKGRGEKTRKHDGGTRFKNLEAKNGFRHSRIGTVGSLWERLLTCSGHKWAEHYDNDVHCTFVA